jgi:hypothetical protein
MRDFFGGINLLQDVRPTGCSDASSQLEEKTLMTTG